MCQNERHVWDSDCAMTGGGSAAADTLADIMSKRERQ